MSLTNYKLGDLITQRREKYDGSDVLPIRGVSRDGFIMARQPDADTSLYNVFYRWDFVFNPARMELNSIALNTEFDKAICSSLYEIFYVSRPDLLLPEYLNLYIKRDEFARCCEFLGWGSAREYCRVGNISDINIQLPALEIQQRLVDVWKKLNDIKQDNDAQAEPLMKLCMCYLKKLYEEYPLCPIGKYIIEYDERNLAGADLPVLGINKDKQFIPTAANLQGVNLSKYKLVKTNAFVFSGMQTGRDKCIRLSLYEDMIPSLVSPAYTTFYINDTIIMPEFFYLMFLRKEMDRYGAFISDASVRANLDWSRFLDISLPIPPLPTQQAIVDIYKCAKECKAIAEQTESLRNKAVPALVQKGAHS